MFPNTHNVTVIILSDPVNTKHIFFNTQHSIVILEKHIKIIWHLQYIYESWSTDRHTDMQTISENQLQNTFNCVE